MREEVPEIGKNLFEVGSFTKNDDSSGSES